MQQFGNGNAPQCALNLLRLNKGEVFYSRLKGLSTEAIDKPIQEASALLHEDAEWLIKTYEPRFDISSVEVDSLIEEALPVQSVQLNGSVSEQEV